MFARSSVATHRTPIASRAEALTILTSLARDGRVSAAIALVRELPPDTGESFEDAFERIIRD